MGASEGVKAAEEEKKETVTNQEKAPEPMDAPKEAPKEVKKEKVEEQ